MTIDRQGTGLAIARVCLGVFFLAEGLSKYRWLTDSSMLVGQLSGWAQNAAPESLNGRYLEHFALPWRRALDEILQLRLLPHARPLVIALKAMPRRAPDQVMA